MEKIYAKFVEPYGDRRQEIVMIGMKMDKDALTMMFDAALLTDAEYALGPKGWVAFTDPFPTDEAAGMKA